MRRMKDEYFAAIESFIDRYREETGISPTLSEIADGTGIPRSTVPRYLAVMRESGVLDYSGHRGITTRRDRAAEEGIRVPVLGSVSCGLPKLAEENIEEYVTLPQALFGRGEMYILRASGESMIEASGNRGRRPCAYTCTEHCGARTDRCCACRRRGDAQALLSRA